jgi:ADP-heptose:LPS heptosyltransferase
MRILIVNITRIGDQLQTSPTIAGLKARYPRARITLAGDIHHTEVCHGIPGVDRVYELDLDRIGRALLAGGAGIVDAFRYTEAVVHDLRRERFDLALNFSSSRMSSVFMRLLRIPDCRGWTMDSEGHRLIAHAWSRLFVASVLHRRYTPYNLVDFYCRVAGVRPPAPRLWYEAAPEGRACARNLLSEAGVGGGERLVALQPGASNSVRQWPAAAFAALGRLLRDRLGARVLVLGAASETESCAGIVRDIGERALSAAGRTDLPTLAALLERAALLVTGDTGPMHLAVAVATPVVAFFFGPAYVWETGPYLADSIAFQTRIACSPCHHAVRCLAPVCRDELTPEMVFAAVHDRLAEDYDTLAQRARGWPAVDVYRIGFDEDGMYDPRPLGPRPEPTEALRLVYREMWRAALDGAPDEATATARLRARWRARMGECAPDLAAVRRALRALGALAARGQALGADLGREASRQGPEIERLERLAGAIEAVDAEIERQGWVEDAVGALARAFVFGKENLTETHALDVLARETAELYGGLARWAGMSLRLLDAVGCAGTADTADGGEESRAWYAHP